MTERPSLDEIFGTTVETKKETPSAERPSLDEIFASSNKDESLIWGEGSQEQPSASRGVLSPLEDVGIEVLRGIEQGYGGTLGKMGAVVNLVNNKTGLEIPNSLLADAAYWKQSADNLPETSVPFKEVINLVGQSPAIMTEFAGTGGLASTVIRAAMLQAADEYGENGTDESLARGAVHGAATMALTAGAFSLAGKGLEQAGKALEKYGPSAAKAVLKLSMPKNSTKEDLDRTFAQLEKLTSKEYRKKIGSTEEIKIQSEKDIAAVKEASEKEIYEKSQQLNTDQKIKNINAKKQFEELSDNHRIAKEALKTDNGEVVAQATDNFNRSVVNTKQSTIDEVATLAADLGKKAELLRAEDSKLVVKGIQEISKKNPDAGVALNEVFIPTLQNTIKSIAKNNPEVFTVTSKGGSLILKPVRKEYTEITERLMGEIKTLKEEFGRSRIIPLNVLQAGKNIFQELSAKSQRMEDNLGASIYTQISRTFNPVNFAETATGGNAALKMLRDANANFSLKADSYDLLKSVFVSPNNKSSTVDTILRSLKGETGSARQLITAIKKAESILPPQDRILSKLEDIAKRAKKQDEMYKEILTKKKKFLAEKERALEIKYSKSVRELKRKQDLLSVEESNRLSDTILGIRNTEREKLTKMKNLIDQRINESSIIDSLQALRQQDEAAIMRIFQNFGAYGTIGTVLTGNFLGAVLPASAAVALSPRFVTGTAKGMKFLSEEAPVVLDKAGKSVMSSKQLKQLIGSSL